jgi:HAD superfamily phosphatase (TIGR01668 family)
MLSLITPHLQVDNVLELRLDLLQSLELDGLLLDLDCTLMDYGDIQFRAEIMEWAQKLKAGGITLCILSNATPERIQPLAEHLGVTFVAKAFKPFPFGCHTALRRLKVHPQRTAVVGDQVFADILAGRLAKLFTILVRPTSSVEPWFTRIKRPLERKVLRRLNQKGSPV